MSKKKNTLVWFRNDLRIEDNPALYAAIKLEKPILAIYIWNSDNNKVRSLGKASMIWLHHALESLEKELKHYGVKLIIQKGRTLSILEKLIEEANIDTLVLNRIHEPHLLSQELEVDEKLTKRSIKVQSFCGNYLYEPNKIKNKLGNPYKVYTAYYKTVIQLEPARKWLKVPLSKLKPSVEKVDSLKISDLNLIADNQWNAQLMNSWDPTPSGGKLLLQKFQQNLIDDYPENRDIPGMLGTSRLSPYLHFGQISPHQIFKSLKNRTSFGSQIFKKELIWREFAAYLLYYFPKTDKEPMRIEFKDFPWKTNRQCIESWKMGMTGYPIVDAGMRELLKKGWMHNRVRMIVASFLVKHLMQPWQVGEAYFWDKLVDADLASNVMNWQWVAGCGADAAPFFRIFNPILQGKRFDPDGAYVKDYIPELQDCPKEFIHSPWEAPMKFKNYPSPIVDHQKARNRALLTYDQFSHFIKNHKKTE